MKHVLLIKRALCGLLEREKRTLSLLMAVSLIYAFFTLYTGTGALINQFQSISSASSYANVSLLVEKEPAPETILAFLTQEPLGAAANVMLMDLSEQENGAVVIGWKGTSFTRWHALEADKSFFTDEQVQSNALIAIRGIGNFESPQSSVSLHGTEYQVVQEMSLVFFMFSKNLTLQNVSGSPRVIIIPYHTFLEQGFHLDVLRVDLAKPIAKGEKAIEGIAAKWFPSSETVLPPAAQTDANIQEQQRSYQSIFICMCILALLNVVILHTQLLHRERKQYVVYSFCGASRLTLILTLTGAWVVCIFTAAVIAYLCVLWMMPVWEAVGISILLTPFNGFVIFLITASLSCMVLLIPTLKVCSMNVRPRGGIT